MLCTGDTELKGYGLVGFPLSHSFSSRYFTEKFKKESIGNCYYRNFPLEDIAGLPDLITAHPELKGLNVTIPYKEKVIAFLDELDEEAKAVGAVNTLKISRSGNKLTLKGYNTDVYGFRTSLEPLLKPSQKHALVLGSGGASKAICFVLKSLDMQVTVVSRKPREKAHISYQELTGERIAACHVIINTSPVGMYPHIQECPDIPYAYLTAGHILYDLVYNPPETEFMKKGEKRGAVAVNGLEMLHLQAEKAWEIWSTG